MGYANVMRMLCEFRITPCGMRNFRITWSSWLPKAISSSFQLQIVHGLKRWILDFLSFEMVYSMHQLDLKKCSKSGCYDCHQEYASWQILFTFSPCIPDLLLANDFQALPKIPQHSPQSWIALVIKLLTKTPKLTHFD